MKKAGRPRVNYSPYSKKGLSSDARIIIALLKKQPQSTDDLCKSTGIGPSTFYFVRPILQDSGVLKGSDEEGYALWFFSRLEKEVEDALFRLTNKGLAFGLEELTSEVGKPLSEIEPEAYKILRTYGLTIRDVDGKKRIQGWENKRFLKLYIERNRDRFSPR